MPSVNVPGVTCAQRGNQYVACVWFGEEGGGLLGFWAVLMRDFAAVEHQQITNDRYKGYQTEKQKVRRCSRKTQLVGHSRAAT